MGADDIVAQTVVRRLPSEPFWADLRWTNERQVMQSDYYVKKFGGYYAWGGGDPSVSLFEHKNWEKDGILRWSVHANRPEFDTTLLNHARDCGAHVTEGVAVEGIDPVGDHHEVRLSDGRRVRCRFFADATGRVTSIASRQRKQFLSEYKNIGIWTHVLGGRPAQSASGDWNIFGRLNVSPIGSFAFEDGWYWYIPVPTVVDGKRVMTHSLGMVTDPRVLKQPGKNFMSGRESVGEGQTHPDPGRVGL